jgi:hypothetical protein
MAEPKQQKAQADEQASSHSHVKETMQQVGLLFLHGFVTGVGLAAGRHVYSATASKLSGKGANVAHLKRVI